MPTKQSRSLSFLALKLANAILPPTAWAALIFFLSAQSTLPSLESTPLDFLIKKAAHVTVYAVLYFLVLRGLKIIWSPSIQNHKLAFFSFLICITYAIIDEVHQSFVPGRHPAIRDIGFDFIGMTLVWWGQKKYS